MLSRLLITLIVLSLVCLLPAADLTSHAAPRLSEITLTPGDYYFRMDGQQQFIFSRNLASYYPTDYVTLLDWSKRAGTRVIRVGLDNGSYGYDNTGAIDEAWAARWEAVFDMAEDNGIYVLPFFGGWVNWNTTGINTWADNPLNAANGGPTSDPLDLFVEGSPTQTAWLKWVSAVVTRWQDRPNILAWELYSEVNYTNGVSEEVGVAFTERVAVVVRAADSHHRPTTASLADMDEWPSFYSSDAVQFINFHPYPPSGELDSYALQEVRRYRTTYHKPVLIGESGLHAANPDQPEGQATTAENAHRGLEHAIWAELVAGAMNGRAFWWEDAYGIYFPDLSWDFLKQYRETELSASRFVSDVDFAGFEPLDSFYSAQVIGGVVGTDQLIIGWYRNAGCEPMDWSLQPVVTGQTVTITVPGSAAGWKVDFYDTKTGLDVVGSAEVGQQGNSVTIPLPDFNDDIAFKMVPLSDFDAVAPAAITTTDAIAGFWTGTITSDTGTFSTPLDLAIQPGCTVGSICGTVATPQLPCAGNLLLSAINGESFVFIEQDMAGASFCVSGGQETLQLQADGSLSYRYTYTAPDGTITSSGGLLGRR